MAQNIAIAFAVAAMLIPSALAAPLSRAPALAPALAAATGAEVLITPTGFEPADVIVEPGSQVVWRNTTLAASSVTSDDDVVVSGSIPPDGAFVAAFPGAGRIDVVDAYGNPGSVTVGWGGLDGAPDALASSAIPDTRFPPFTEAEIGVHPVNAVLLSRRRLIVGITPDATVAQVNSALSAARTPLIGSITDDALLFVATPDSGDFAGLESAAAALEASPVIRYAVADGPRRTDVLPGDPQSGFEADLPSGSSAATGWVWNDSPITNTMEWAGTGANWSLENVRAPQAWNLREAMEDAGVAVAAALVDNEVFEGHPELPLLEQGEICTEALLYPDCNDDTGSDTHGTHVAGIMSGTWSGPDGYALAGRQSLDNGTRIIGMPWGVRAGFGDPELSSFSFVDLHSALVSRAQSGEPIRVINQSAGWKIDPDDWVSSHAMKTCSPGRADDAAGTGPCLPSTDDVWIQAAERLSLPMRDVLKRGAANRILYTTSAGNAGTEWCWTGSTLYARPAPSGVAGCVTQVSTAMGNSTLTTLGLTWSGPQWGDPNPGPNPIIVVESLGNFLPQAAAGVPWTLADGYGVSTYELFARSPFSQVGGHVSAPGGAIYSTCRPDDDGQDRNGRALTRTTAKRAGRQCRRRSWQASRSCSRDTPPRPR